MAGRTRGIPPVAHIHRIAEEVLSKPSEKLMMLISFPPHLTRNGGTFKNVIRYHKIECMT
jgi:hypothetical protein